MMLSSVPQSIYRVVGNGFALWQRVIKQVLPIAILSLLFAAIPGFWIPAIDDVSLLAAWHLLQSHFLFLWLYIYILLFVFSMLLLMMVPHPSLQKKSVKEAFMTTFKRFPLIVAVSILYQAIGVFTLALFVLPGIYFLMLLMFAIPLVVIEKMNPVQALIHSGDLVWLQWWRTFAVFALVLGIYLLVMLIIHGGFYQLYQQGIWKEFWYVSFRHIADVVINALYLPFFCAVVIMQLHDLKLRQPT